MDLGISGRVAVVTGASRGIGRAVAAALAAEGVKLVLSARGAEALEQAEAELSATGADVVGVAGDVCEPDTTTTIVSTALETHGGLDIVVNNAGSDPGHLPIERLTDADWEDTFRLNVVSAM